MITRGLGKNPVIVGSVGQGTGFEPRGKIDVNNASKVLREGVHLGLNFIDTAEDYADGLAEIAVGKAVKGIRAKTVIASKFSVSASKHNDVIRACQNSLKRLKTDYIDLYQLHWPNPKVELEETMSALMKLRKNGLIRQIGISNFSQGELIRYKNLLLESKTVSIQYEYNLFERTAETDGTFEFCKKNRLSFIAYSPLDQGRLTSLNHDQTRLLKNLSTKYSRSVAQIILAWIIYKKFIIAIPKTLNTKHILENAEVMKFKLDKKDVEKINMIFFTKVKYVPVDKINVSSSGERNRKVYKTLEEAKNNSLNFIPSPQDLAISINNGYFLKPVRLVPARATGRYDLINGRIRYWAWVIAYGNTRPIPAYIREGI